MWRRILIGVAAGSLLAVGLVTAAGATGQPNQDCADFPSTPGHSSTAPGSAFNQNGKSGSVYAGQQSQNTRTNRNNATNSQYDVACSKQP